MGMYGNGGGPKWLWLAVMMAILILGRMTAVNAYDGEPAYGPETAPAEAVPEASVPAEAVVPLPFGRENAKGMVLMDGRTGRVLFGVNPDERLPMASTTKIMTALLALEQPNIDTSFVVDAAAIRVEGTSMGLTEGDSVTLRVLAGGMLLASGNDAANAAAVYIDGSQGAFARRMNRRAAEIGMENTSFVTPSGLDNENHYSTARDMGLLACEALKNPDFAAICASPSMKLAYGNPPYDRWLSNHNRLLREYKDAVGVKTGFTKKSGRCLVSAASRGDILLVCVTLGAADDWNLHKRALDAGFEALTAYEPSSFLPKDLRVPVTGGTRSSVRVTGGGEALSQKLALTAEEAGRVEVSARLSALEYAPVEEGQIVGEAVLTLDGETLAEIPLVSRDVSPAKPREKKGLAGLWRNITKVFRERK